MSLTEQIANAPKELWLYTSAGVIGLIAVASGFKFLALQGGGKAVAESLGGVLIHQNTRDSQQRQLLNVVEEMAIAAGMPVPPVYLIRENSINAFAAGFGIHDAVIGINQGTIDLLNRQELQGVVAHEFSHILNGDMRINLRIIALLNGILILGIIGGGLMRGSMFSRSRDRGGLIALGIGLLIIGYGGTFFGQLIKAAVSRQREYLADASAVQFTRSSQGIANALKKIGAHSSGSHIESPKADENSHLFFGAIKSFSSMMATHQRHWTHAFAHWIQNVRRQDKQHALTSRPRNRANRVQPETKTPEPQALPASQESPVPSRSVSSAAAPMSMQPNT